MKKDKKQKGLSDGELSAKYDTGKTINFDRALKVASKVLVRSDTLKSKK